MNPYQYYRDQHPEQFSDSMRECRLTRELFEFQLSKLSSDMKQDEFENFTRQLVCRLITPNLIPQTGPVGGGDGKTDIETHAVSNDIAVHWYVPGGGCRGSEKWAFAVSCKSNWKEKVKHDVKNIVETGRGFTKILFFTNQLVRSKEKADLYLYFRTLYNVDVEIFDQKWYVQSVFDNKCEDVAVSALNLSASLSPQIIEGPNDRKRKELIKKIEDNLLAEGNESGLDPNYVENLIESAKLSRYIDDPPYVIRGKFERALSEAKIHGLAQQEYEIIYQMGWTEFYWFQSPDGMYASYSKLKDMIEEEVNVPRIEKLYNLFNLISGASAQGLFINPVDIRREREFLNLLYERISQSNSTRFSALFLKICLLECEMIYDGLEEHELNKRLVEYQAAMLEANNCLDIHLSSHADVFAMLGEVFSDNSTYEDVLDTISSIIARREGDVMAANIQYKRGSQNIDGGNFKSAIRHLGQCAVLYQKEECLGELVKTNCFLAFSSSELDLINCERAYYVKAAALMIHKISTTGVIDHMLLTVLLQLSFLEVKAGQLTNLFNWLNIVDALAQSCRDFLDEEFMMKRTQLDAALAAKFLCSDVTQAGYDMLPDILERQGLDLSRDVLLHMLGYAECMSSSSLGELYGLDNWPEKLVSCISDDFFIYPLQVGVEELRIKSIIKGCNITISHPSNSAAKVAAETILSFIESIFSTNETDEILITTPCVNIKLSIDNSCESTITPGIYSTEYNISLRDNDLNHDKLWAFLLKFFSIFLTRNPIGKSIETYLEAKQSKEKFIERLSLLAGYKADIENIVGQDVKASVYAWRDAKDHIYDCRKDAPTSSTAPKYRGEQNQCEIDSLIDMHLWDLAVWRGVGFLHYKQDATMYVCICFENIEHGSHIMDQWMHMQEDSSLPLRISFIEGIDRDNPAWYRVLITSDPVEFEYDGVKPRYHQIISRIHTMTPSQSTNLENFKAYCKTGGKIKLCVMQIHNKQINLDTQRLRSSILFANFVFKNAWEIGENEIDTAGILPTDNPIIPYGHEKDAPVFRISRLRTSKI